MSMTVLGTVGGGTTQTGISDKVRYTLGTVIFIMLYLYQTANILQMFLSALIL